MFVPVLTLSTKDGNKLLQQSKTGFKKTIITWNKYIPEMSKQSKINYLNSLIDPIFKSQ